MKIGFLQSPFLLPRVPGKTTLDVWELCVNESRISESKVKSSEKDILPDIFSPFAGVSIFHVCSMESSRCFLKNRFPLCRSPTTQPVLLTCQLEPRALDGVERGDSGKGSWCAGVTEEELVTFDTLM